MTPPPAVQPKPTYQVPTMREIAALESNGFDAVSTFSGCGGSSTGYRMAGFRVLWASEFVEAARDTYRANAAPYTILDGRDVRDVTGADILTATGKAVGELDLFDGSPPCASFSTAGRREQGWGTIKKYSDTAQRSDDLFFEYARLIREVQPRVFVAENVSGLVKGTAKGYFKLILAELRSCGYRVAAKVLDASWLGVPQMRQRLIFVGVREDLGMDPVHPRPLPYQYTVRDALPWIIEQGNNAGFTDGRAGMRPTDQPSPTIGSTPVNGNGRFPASRVTARLIHDTSGQFGAGDVTDRPALAVTVGANSVNSRHFQVHAPMIARSMGDGVTIEVPVDQPAPTVMAHGIGGVAAHQTAVVAQQGPIYDGAGNPLDPETKQAIGLDRLDVARRYDQQRGGAVPGIVRRKLTLGELRAIGGFPPDFILTGTYAQRWERIGRAVPPVMMSRIAGAIRDGILVPLRDRGVI